MEAAKHTPGPWVHATDMGQVGSVEFADGTVIAQTQQLPGDLRSEQRNANARLIAAAPELLAACQAIVEYQRLAESDETYGLLNAYAKAFEASIAAVAKATGEPA